MTGLITRRTFFSLLAALVVVLSSVFVASAATKKSKAPTPKEIKLACTQSNGTLTYITRESQCASSGTLMKIKPGPVDVCVKKHGTRRGTTAASSRRLPAGSTRHTDQLSLCGPASQPNEMPLVLPNPRKEWFCVEKGDKSMRWVARKPHCRTKGRFPEFPAFVPAHTFPTPATPGNQGNGPLTANADSATTDEDTSQAIRITIAAVTVLRPFPNSPTPLIARSRAPYVCARRS